jgi:hypothetical protein
MTGTTVAGLQDCVQQLGAPDDELRQQHCRCTQEQMLQMFRDYDCWVFDCDGEAINAERSLSRFATAAYGGTGCLVVQAVSCRSSVKRTTAVTGSH